MKKKYQVFVSSTYKDLQPERQAVVQAILMAGHIPAGMELFAAGDKSQLDTIRRWIEESDVFMLILGARYGSIEPESGKSYIHLEYEYAIEKNKPYFAVVLDDAAVDQKVTAQGKEVLELDHPDFYKPFKQVVVSKMCRFFTDTKDLKLAVLESLMKIASDSDLPGWVRSDEVSDPIPLIEEMKQLRMENTALKKSLGELQKKLQSETFGGHSFEELLTILGKEKVKFKHNNKDIDAGILDLTNHFLDRLVIGIENRRGTPDSDIFLFYNVLPTLALYGLAEKGKPNKDGIQHFQLSEDGRRFATKLKPLFQKAGLPPAPKAVEPSLAENKKGTKRKTRTIATTKRRSRTRGGSKS